MPARLHKLGALILLATGACASLPASTAQRRTWAFTAPWDARSDSSVRLHASHLDGVVSGWLPLDTTSGMPFLLYADTVARSSAASANRIAMVTDGLGGTFHPELVRALARDDAALARAAHVTVERMNAGRYHGVVLDFEGLSAADVDATAKVVRALADSVHAHGLGPVAMAVPAIDTAGYPAAAFIPAADYILVMLYDQHWSTSPPGPIATPEWVRAALARRVADVGASRVIAALPIYGYEWPVSGPATTISYEDARRLAAAAGVELERDAASHSLHATNVDHWTVWVSDAGLLRDLMSEADALGVSHIALWRLGLEDPRVWQMLR
jgi:spore germination protein YaaH